MKVTEAAAKMVAQGVEVDPDAAEETVAAVDERLEAISARLEELRPPEGGVGARRRRLEGEGDPYEGAGAAYREAAEAGDAGRLAELTREREDLLEERALLQRQRDTLKGLLRRARERQQRETAPDRLADRLEAFPGLLSDAEEALERFREARDALEEAGAEIVSCRKLLGDDAPGLEPGELRRWGLLCARVPGEVGTVTVESARGGAPRERPHLFRTPTIQQQRFGALGPPREELVAAVRRRLRQERDRKVRHVGGAPEIPESRVRDAVREARRRATIAGEELEVETTAETN